MKSKLTLTLLALAAVSLNLHAMTSALPAPLPEFMDDAQAAKWTADQAAAAQTTSAQEPSTQFFTGKPYVADAGGYVFKYRTYNPEMSRWTSSDPSGFSDGANNNFYAPVPTTSLDNSGLLSLSVSGTNPPAPITTSGNTVTYNANTISLINASTFASIAGSTFSSLFPTYSETAGTLSGTITVNNITPLNNGTNAGFSNIQGSFTGNGSYNWIQIITTNYDTPATEGTIISTSGTQIIEYDNNGDTSTPFYTGGKRTGNNPYITDGPYRQFSEISSSRPTITWTADTFLVSVVGNAITVYGGYTWGFTLE